MQERIFDEFFHRFCRLVLLQGTVFFRIKPTSFFQSELLTYRGSRSKMLRVSPRFFIGAAPVASFFSADDDAVPSHTSTSQHIASSTAGSSPSATALRGEERRRLRLLSKEFGVSAANIFDRLTSALEAFEDIDRRTAMSATALTQRLAFDEMTHTALTSSLHDVIADATGPANASGFFSFSPGDDEGLGVNDDGHREEDARGGAKTRRNSATSTNMAQQAVLKAADDKLDALALKRSLHSLEYEFFYLSQRRQSRLREAERTGLARARARELFKKENQKVPPRETSKSTSISSISSPSVAASSSAPPPPKRDHHHHHSAVGTITHTPATGCDYRNTSKQHSSTSQNHDDDFWTRIGTSSRPVNRVGQHDHGDDNIDERCRIGKSSKK